MTREVEHAIWWQLDPLSFLGAPTTAGTDGAVHHRLGRLQPWLDYASTLGATGLALGPIFAASTHGYDTVDHFSIDARLGDDADFAALIEAAHRRGLHVLLDGVFNHVSRDHPAFREVLRESTHAPHAAWFIRTTPADREPDYLCFEGHRQLVTLNHAEPTVADYVARVMIHWLDKGADGWRLDAAYAVPRGFWAGVLPRVRAAHPGAYLVGEVIHGDYAATVRDTGMDAVTQYELWKAIWSALNDRNFFELDHALGRHNGFLESFAPLTFVGNHDVTRLASQLTDRRHLPHALAILLSVGGTPSIYAGDEQGFEGVKEHRIGGDDAIRPAFPAVPGDLPPGGAPLFTLHRSLLALRRQHPWVTRAPSRTLHLRNDQLVLRMSEGPERLFLAMTLGDEDVALPVPEACAVLAGAGTLTEAGTAHARVGLTAHGWAILSG